MCLISIFLIGILQWHYFCARLLISQKLLYFRGSRFSHCLLLSRVLNCSLYQVVFYTNINNIVSNVPVALNFHHLLSFFSAVVTDTQKVNRSVGRSVILDPPTQSHIFSTQQNIGLIILYKYCDHFPAVEGVSASRLRQISHTHAHTKMRRKKEDKNMYFALKTDEAINNNWL